MTLIAPIINLKPLKMKKLVLNLIMIMALVLTIASCKGDKKEKTTAEEATTETVEDAVEEAESTEVEEATETSAESDEVTEEEGLDKETVTVTYSKVVNGVEIKSEKTFSGSLKQVDARVKAFEDSLRKVDPKIKIIRE